jgi:preprotein translocase subunit Sec61beta
LNNFLTQGGIINFYTEGKNLHFEISPDAADAAGLQLSSRLLALARVVRTGPAPAAPPH